MLPTPFARPLYITAKGAGCTCNLECAYCYYLDKSSHYSYPQDGYKQRSFMPDGVLETFIRQYIEAQTSADVLFTWHGGEPLMRGIDFYRKAIGLQQKYGTHVRIDNCIQTNGTMITDEWCAFFKEHGWLVGVSIDGPECFHDAYRRSHGDSPSFAKVMHGIELLNSHGVEWNAMAVVNDYNAGYPLEFYDFFKELGCRYIQFTPIVERIGANGLAAPDDMDDCRVTGYSVSPTQWGEFLCAVFDEWVANDVGTVFVQFFDAVLANWVGVPPGLCSLGRYCGHAGAVEHNGDLYSCDHFVFPEYKLGNICDTSIFEMMSSERQIAFGNRKRMSLPGQCNECRWLDICNGECPKNRFAVADDGIQGLNYLCKGYRRFFEHSAPAMQFMRDEILAGRSPSNVMNWQS